MLAMEPSELLNCVAAILNAVDKLRCRTAVVVVAAEESIHWIWSESDRRLQANSAGRACKTVAAGAKVHNIRTINSHWNSTSSISKRSTTKRGVSLWEVYSNWQTLGISF